MYSLIVTNEPGAWDRGRYELPQSRFGEYTAEAIHSRYRALEPEAVAELQALPTLLAYEEPRSLAARFGRITRIRQSARQVIRFEYEINEDIAPIPPEQLSELAWDLDIADWEMNRTHWAVKDVDLFQVLAEAGIRVPQDVESHFVTTPAEATMSASSGLHVTPKVFAIPSGGIDTSLVSVMMPFSRDFDDVYATITAACEDATLGCQRVDDVWQESTIIQDVFNLIYRSSIVVVDLTGRNSNVLYEAGIAHTLGRDVVPISQDVETIPFDLVHHRVLKYLPNDEGLQDMREKLRRRLRNLSSRR